MILRQGENGSLRKRTLSAALLLAAFAALAAPQAEARSHHSASWAREHFAAAERMREALNGRPSAERTRHDYQRILDAYRKVYLGAPSSPKADPSVVAVAETLVEMGRRFNDDRILAKAIDQYKFLRREYPGSKYRFDGLFTIGEIYKDDLNEPESARAAFQDFLRRYPHNRLADEAHHAVAELDKEAKSKKSGAEKPFAKNHSEKESANRDKKNDGKAAIAANDAIEEPSSEPESHGSVGVPRVTGIRHWSTPDYSRVAIDLENEVKFSSRRIATPARIFFDLRDTQLASTLVGKSFDVDDGFLKKVRVAQFAPNRTRVVLEVDNVSEYDAFLLPNPYRLIIDIHRKNWHARQPVEAPEAVAGESDVPAAPKVGSSTEADTDAPDSKAAIPAAAALATDSLDAADVIANTAPTVETVTTKSSPMVVKKIVDVDDDRVTASSGSAKHVALLAKRSISAKKLSNADSNANSKEPDSPVTDSSPVSSNAHRVGARGLSSVKRSSDLYIREARPTSAGDRSLIRILGLKIGKIVIDAGHGGHDTGTIGPNGLREKDLVLEVGRRLGKLLETRLGAEVVYTRKDDTFIPLETRTAIANQARADLFVSIHANSSHDSAARGVETYYLNFTSSPEALEVAARENAVSEKSIFELQDLVKKIALKEKIEESREFAADVQQSLHSGLAVKNPAIRNRGVKKAPFIVLIGANMPSILAEISFVSNPTDEHRLATSEYRQRIAESLYRGIARYVNGLSGVKVASKMDKGTGQ